MITAEPTSKAIKLARPDHPILPLLEQRFSPRAFDARPVEMEKLRSMLEAARWSASGGNGQPWHFFVATQDQPELFAALAACLYEGNALWARHAPVLMLTAATMTTSSGRVNGHAFHDVGLATQNLVVQATALDLYVHIMAGFSGDTARQVLAIPEGVDPVTMMAIGYLGDPATLPEKAREQELAARARKPLPDFVFEGRWGNPAAFVGEKA